MKYLKSYEIFEKLGFSEYLTELVDYIYDMLSKGENDFEVETELGNKAVNIQVEYNTERQEYLGLEYEAYINVVNTDPEDLVFKLYLTRLEKKVIFHELKHIDRSVRKNFNTDPYYYLNQVGRNITNKYQDLFYTENTNDIMIFTLYMINPDEFESYYNQFYLEIKELINNNMTPEEKRKIIKDFLEEQRIYDLYKFFIESGGFVLSEMFKNKQSMIEYLKILIIKMKQYNDIERYQKWGTIEEILLDNDNINIRNVNKIEKEINFYINKMLQKGWKKFHRLYTI